MKKDIVFFDTEVGIDDKKVHDIGAVRNGLFFHSANLDEFQTFIDGAEYVCGHNIVHHDLKYVQQVEMPSKAIDTLYLSPLLFPCRPYHNLVKDDKLQSDQLNNPLNDAQKAMQLFYDEVNAFNALNVKMKQVYCCLLYQYEEFTSFFDYVGFTPYRSNVEKLVREEYAGNICENADVSMMIKHYPFELAYSLALIRTADYHSVSPPWLIKNYPRIDNVIKFLCHIPCEEGCLYCRDRLDIHKNLTKFFGYKEFRTYNGEPLQERAAQAAVDGKSLLAVFPTGGGKSITFQLPALMVGECAHAENSVLALFLQSYSEDNRRETSLTVKVFGKRFSCRKVNLISKNGFPCINFS